LDEIRATIQQSDIGEPWKGVELPRPGVGGDRRWKEFRFRRTVLFQRENPSRRRKFGSPHYIELQDRRIADARVEPLHVELVALGRVVGCALQLDPDPGIELHEALQLFRNERPLGAKRGSGKGEDGLVLIRASSTCREEHRYREDDDPADFRLTPMVERSD